MRVAVLDGNIHGKIVCSIIRDYGVEVDLITVIDKGNHCTCDKLCEGLVECLFGGYDIVNISLGLPYMTHECRNMIKLLLDKGIKVVSASGNKCTCYPSRLDGVISVGACDEEGNLCDYTVEDSYDILELGSYKYKGKIYHGTSFACARHSGKLARGGDS